MVEEFISKMYTKSIFRVHSRKYYLVHDWMYTLQLVMKLIYAKGYNKGPARTWLLLLKKISPPRRPYTCIIYYASNPWFYFLTPIIGGAIKKCPYRFIIDSYQIDLSRLIQSLSTQFKY